MDRVANTDNGILVRRRTLARARAWIALLLFLPSVILAAVRVGQPAPAWSLLDVNGQLVRSTDLHGKVVLISFFTTWCVPCQWEAPDLAALQTEQGSNGLVILGVAVRQPSAEITPFLQEQHLNYLVCPSTDSMLWDYEVLPAAAIPVTAVIDRNGVLSAWYRYYRAKEYHESLLLPLLAAAPALPRPRLSIQRAGDKLQLAWPSAATNFVLEVRPASQPAATWTPLASTPTATNGLNTITLAVQRGARLYRLRKI